MLIAVGLVTSAVLAEQKLTRRKADLDVLRAQLALAAARPTPVPRKMPYDASAREFLALATSQWPAMLTTLESVEIVGVTPSSIDVSPLERTVRVEVEFADYAALLKYVDALNAGEPVPRWALVQAQVSSRGPAGTAVTNSVATVRANW